MTHFRQALGSAIQLGDLEAQVIAKMLVYANVNTEFGH